jgi:uncharacterized protein with HEPN domain
MERFGGCDVFMNDVVYRNSASMDLLQIGECAGRLSANLLAETENRIPWRYIRATRNRMAHAYNNVDWNLMWDTLERDVPELYDFCKKMLENAAIG